jgi:hypothetical protein
MVALNMKYEKQFNMCPHFLFYRFIIKNTTSALSAFHLKVPTQEQESLSYLSQQE